MSAKEMKEGIIQNEPRDECGLRKKKKFDWCGIPSRWCTWCRYVFLCGHDVTPSRDLRIRRWIKYKLLSLSTRTKRRTPKTHQSPPIQFHCNYKRVAIPRRSTPSLSFPRTLYESLLSRSISGANANPSSLPSPRHLPKPLLEEGE